MHPREVDGVTTQQRTAGEDGDVATVLAATRDLLRIRSAGDARQVAVELVEALGGSVIAAEEADGNALPVDLSFGAGPPLLPTAADTSVAHMLLARHLPGFTRDAHRAVELLERTHRLAEDAEVDQLTGLPNRRVLGRALGRLHPADVVVLLDLDHFKALNDQHGHEAGDKVLHAFGQTIASTVRVRDLAGRYGGEEFLLILSPTAGTVDADALLQRLRGEWERRRPHPITFSAGLAPAGADPQATLRSADAALYTAKRAGRDRWVWAAEAVDGTPSPAREGADQAPTGSFVAHSRLTVPPEGRTAVVTAFRDRLGRVDGWEGFHRLEVWADRRDPTVMVMVSWWDTEAAFQAYMASEDHRISHERIPGGAFRPHPDRFTRYEVIAR